MEALNDPLWIGYCAGLLTCIGLAKLDAWWRKRSESEATE